MASKVSEKVNKPKRPGDTDSSCRYKGVLDLCSMTEEHKRFESGKRPLYITLSVYPTWLFAFGMPIAPLSHLFWCHYTILVRVTNTTNLAKNLYGSSLWFCRNDIESISVRAGCTFTGWDDSFSGTDRSSATDPFLKLWKYSVLKLMIFHAKQCINYDGDGT